MREGSGAFRCSQRFWFREGGMQVVYQMSGPRALICQAVRHHHHSSTVLASLDAG